MFLIVHTIQIISRGKNGKSAVAAAAYRAGMIHDYTHKVKRISDRHLAVSNAIKDKTRRLETFEKHLFMNECMNLNRGVYRKHTLPIKKWKKEGKH